MKKPALFGLLAAVLASQLLASCTDVGIVGGRCDQQQVIVDGSCLDACPAELAACDQQCVDLDDNEEHCGSCGNACGAEQSCLEGECVDSGGGAGGSAGSAGSAGEGGSAGGAGESSGGSAGQAGQGGMPPICEPPFDTPDKCGSCDVQCSSDEPVCAAVGGGYQCVPECEPSADLCDGTCTDVNVDPDHCGECGNVCDSGYCYQGMCVGGTYGHVVLMCIDYAETARSSPIQWLLGNSVFLPANRFTRVLAFDGFTPNLLRDNVDLTLSWAAGEVAQRYSLTHESDQAQIPNLLSIESFDTLLVYAQTEASSGQLGTLGASWKTALSDFVDDGGTVVVLSGGAMLEFIAQADLLDLTAETAVTDDSLFNRTPTDSVGINVLTPFKSRANTCRFTTSEPPSATLSYVITGDPQPTALDAPVVVHRILTGP